MAWLGLRRRIKFVLFKLIDCLPVPFWMAISVKKMWTYKWSSLFSLGGGEWGWCLRVRVFLSMNNQEIGTKCCYSCFFLQSRIALMIRVFSRTTLQPLARSNVYNSTRFFCSRIVCSIPGVAVVFCNTFPRHNHYSLHRHRHHHCHQPGIPLRHILFFSFCLLYLQGYLHGIILLPWDRKINLKN